MSTWTYQETAKWFSGLTGNLSCCDKIITWNKIDGKTIAEADDAFLENTLGIL